MKMIKKTASLCALAATVSFAASSASAAIIDFKSMAEASGSHGESIWTTLEIVKSDFTLDVTATKDGSASFAYLDAGNAGLGVCGAPNDPTKVNKKTFSGANRCAPGSDDNTTVGEALFFTFDVDVIIEDIWLNNNHDDDKSLFGDSVSVGGSDVTFTTDMGGPADYYVGKSYFVAAGTAFEIAYSDEEFYVSGMSVKAAVTEPATIGLLGLGLLGLGMRKRKQA